MADPLKIKTHVATLDEVPGPLKLFYQPAPDAKGFELQFDGPGESAKLSEFRENNRALNSKVTDLEAEKVVLAGRLKGFEGVDVSALQTKLTETEAALAAAQTEVTTLKAAQVDPKIVADLETKAATLEAALASEKGAKSKAQFETAVSTEAVRAGVRAATLPFLLLEASKTFKVNEATGALETSEFSTKSPGEKLSVSEWMAGQLTANPFCFESSRGGGARPANNGGTPPARQTVSRDPAEFGRNLEKIARGDVDVQ